MVDGFFVKLKVAVVQGCPSLSNKGMIESVAVTVVVNGGAAFTLLLLRGALLALSRAGTQPD